MRERADDRPVTLIDLTTPTNKTTLEGREAYLTTRQDARSAGANLVEVDLVLQGRPLLEYSRDGLPVWDYAISVTRAPQPDRYEIYTTTLQKPLPPFNLPPASDDRRTVLDLQSVFGRCYDQGGFAERIDYRRAPAVPIREGIRPWLSELLHLEGPLSFPSESGASTSGQEEIARAAYYLWISEGRPQGRDQEHWFRAVEQ